MKLKIPERQLKIAMTSSLAQKWSNFKTKTDIHRDTTSSAESNHPIFSDVKQNG
jgi:hypothetical protein